MPTSGTNLRLNPTKIHADCRFTGETVMSDVTGTPSNQVLQSTTEYRNSLCL